MSSETGQPGPPPAPSFGIHRMTTFLQRFPWKGKISQVVFHLLKEQDHYSEKIIPYPTATGAVPFACPWLNSVNVSICFEESFFVNKKPLILSETGLNSIYL